MLDDHKVASVAEHPPRLVERRAHVRHGAQHLIVAADCLQIEPDGEHSGGRDGNQGIKEKPGLVGGGNKLFTEH